MARPRMSAEQKIGNQIARKVIRAIQRVVKQSSFRTGMMRAAGKLHLQFIKHAMSQSGVGGYGKWVALSPRRQAELGRVDSILKDTGALQRSMKVVATADGWEITVGVEYGDIHQNGGTNAQGAYVPARPYLLLTDEWAGHIWDGAILPFIRERTILAVRKALAA